MVLPRPPPPTQVADDLRVSVNAVVISEPMLGSLMQGLTKNREDVTRSNVFVDGVGSGNT